MTTLLLEPKNALSIYKGESKTLILTIEKPDPDNLGSCIPVDITGATVYFTVKEKPEATEVFIRKTSATVTEVELTDPRGGIAKIFLAPADTINMDPRRSYVFDVWVTLSSGDQYPVVKPSTFKVLQGVTTI